MIANRMCQCTRCRNKHAKSDRVDMPTGRHSSESVCPRCSGKSFYDITPAKAWLMSGIIEMGTEEPQPDAAAGQPVFFATGPYGDLKATLCVQASRVPGRLDAWTVRGMPEARDEKDAFLTFRLWVNKCAGANGTRYAHGVLFELQDSV